MSRMWSGPAYDVVPRLCDHHAPNDCDRCDGVAADEWEVRRAHRAPAGKPRSTAELWALIEACRPTRTDAEEAKTA